MDPKKRKVKFADAGYPVDKKMKKMSDAALTADALNQCTVIVSDVKDSLEKENNEGCQIRIKKWKEELKELEKNLKISDLPIAVVGATGAGKSSLINAIVDHEILPTSGLKACTSVVVKIENNTTGNDYEAEILFLEREEWEKERNDLIKDMMKKDGTMRRNYRTDDDSPGGIACSKMKAVYGDFTCEADLNRETEITAKLGTRETIRDQSVEDFRDQIEKYIVSNMTEGQQLWPIVKMVTIKVPGFNTGCTLIDLPGVGDANAARNVIAEDFLLECSNILIVSVIHRAISEKMAKKFLGDRFRQQLELDGKYNSQAVQFVCTKNDDVDEDGLTRELKLKEKVQPLQREIDALYRNTGQNNESEIRDKTREVQIICAKERSKETKKQLKIDFNKGLEELRRQQNADDDDDDDDDDDGGDDKRNVPEVFCVSSNDYLSLKLKRVPKVFRDVDDTEIPDLKNWIKSLGESNKDQKAQKIIFELAFFVKSVQSYLKDNDFEFKTSSEIVKSGIEQISQELQRSLKETATKLYNDLIKEVYNIETNLSKGQANAESEAINKCCSWDKYHVKTLKAVITRHGSYQSRTCGNIDFNDDLTCPLFESILCVWKDFFSFKVPFLISMCCDSSQKEIKKSLVDVSRVVEQFIPNALLKGILSLIQDGARLKFEKRKEKIESEIMQNQGKISRSGYSIVKNSLAETYDSCPMSGHGLKNKIQKVLREGIEAEKRSMFSEVKNSLTLELRKLMHSVKEELFDLSKELSSYVVERFEPLWLGQKKSTIIQDIDESYQSMTNLCESYGISVSFEESRESETEQRAPQDKENEVRVFRPDHLQRAIRRSLADYDRQEYSEYRLKAFCSKHDMEFLGKTPANGNCFFEAISSQLERLNMYQLPEQLRQNVVDYLKQHPTYETNHEQVDVRDFVEDFSLYCEKMARNTEWADHVIVVTMARMLGMDIMIVTSSPDATVENCIVVVDGGPGASNTKTLLLGHYWERHYQSLKPKGEN